MEIEEPKKKRLFFGVNLSMTVTKRIADAVTRLERTAKERGLRVAWQGADKLHVTVRFLGWTRPEAIEALRDEARAVCAAFRPFDLGARGAGGFPERGDPHILYVGVVDASGALARLAGDMERAAVKLGYEPENRKFHAHLTIGRVKEGQGTGALLDPLREQDFGTSSIKELILYESSGNPAGSVYTPLFRVPLDVRPAS